jgi:membrane protein
MPRRFGFVIQAARIFLRFTGAVRYYAHSIVKQMVQDDLLLLASGLAFNGLLTVIPLMLLTASAIGIFLHSSDVGIASLNDILDTVFPPQPFASSIKESIVGVVTDIVTYRKQIGVFGFLVLLWTATFLFDALRSVLHRIYHIERTRGLLVSFVHDVGFVFLAFILFVGSNFAIWIYSLVREIALRIPALQNVRVPAFDDAIPTMIVLVLTACMFYIVYRYMADAKPPKTAAVISTICTTILWVVSGRLFAIYLSDFSAMGKIYGPYAFLFVLLLWSYYCCIIFVVGGIIGQVYWERRKMIERLHRP